MNPTVKKWGIGVFVLAAAVVLILYLWRYYNSDKLDRYIASANGRIEATEIDIATKIAGRVKEILVDEGDFVQAGQVLARMDTAVLEAQLKEAKARLKQAESAVEIANSMVVQRRWEKKAAQAVVEQRQAEVEVSKKRLERSQVLIPRNAVSQQKLEDDRASFLSAKALLRAAEADVARADVAIATAKLQVQKAQSDIEAYNATIERIQADLDDNVLISPRSGRVQYRVAEPGEVLSAGGVVLNMVDLTDVYMTFFLPTAQAGKVALGTEVRLVLDAISQYVIPAKISFVADIAQFTPKTVETTEERQKLMFRIKARIDEELLKKYLHQVKTGLPGMAYVRLNTEVEWPPELQIRLPE